MTALNGGSLAPWQISVPHTQPTLLCRLQHDAAIYHFSAAASNGRATTLRAPLNDRKSIVRKLSQVPQQVHSASARGIAGLDDPHGPLVAGIVAGIVAGTWASTVRSGGSPFSLCAGAFVSTPRQSFINAFPAIALSLFRVESDILALAARIHFKNTSGGGGIASSATSPREVIRAGWREYVGLHDGMMWTPDFLLAPVAVCDTGDVLLWRERKMLSAAVLKRPHRSAQFFATKAYTALLDLDLTILPLPHSPGMARVLFSRSADSAKGIVPPRVGRVLSTGFRRKLDQIKWRREYQVEIRRLHAVITLHTGSLSRVTALRNCGELRKPSFSTRSMLRCWAGSADA